MSIYFYLFLSLWQSKFAPISFNPVFFISVYSSYIHLYFFNLLSIHLCFFIPLCQSRLIPISLSIQIHASFNPGVLYLCLFFVYLPLFISISCLSTSISLYLIVNPDWCLSLCQFNFTAISFKPVSFISVYFTYIHLYLFLSLVYPPLFFIPLRQSRLMPISFYFLVNPNSRLYISNPFYLSHSILFISAYICFYLLSIHLCLFIPLFQSRLIPISLSIRIHASFNPVFFISVFSSYIHLYLFLSLAYPSLFLYTSLSIQIHGYIFQTCFPYLCLFFVYPPIFVSISCLSISISLYLFVNPE